MRKVFLPLRVERCLSRSYTLREDILAFWGQEAWIIEQFRPASFVHWTFNIFFLSFCHQYGQDVKYKNFSQQPSQAEGMYGSTIHTSGTSAIPVRNGRPSCPEKGCSFSSAQTPGEQTQHKATGHHLLNKDHQPGNSSTLQYGEGHGWCLPGLPWNQLPSDLRFSSLIFVARASCVDLAGSLGFQKDLSHTLPMCAVPYMSCKSTRCLRRVCFQSDAKAAHAIPQKLSSRTF